MAPLRTTGFVIGAGLTRLSLRLLGFRRTIAVLRWLPAPMAGRPADPADADRWAGAIRNVAGRPFGATCLDRSVLLWFLMLQRSLDGQLRIGLAFEGNRLDGHAWVELDGRVVNDDPDIADHFSVFDEDPTAVAFT